MLTKLWTAILGLSVSMGVAADAWMNESGALGAFDIMPTFPAQLISEEVSFKLAFDRYQADIHYQINSSVDNRRFVFPLLCVNTVKSKGVNKDNAPCLYSFKVSVNDEYIPEEQIQVQDVQDMGYLLYDFKAISMASGFAAQQYSEHGVLNNIDLSRLLLKFYAFEVSSKEDMLKIHIQFESPYYFYQSGGKESPFYYYSNDILFYGFSTSAKWATEELAIFSVNVDATELDSNLDFKSGVNFKQTSSNYFVYEKQDVKLRKLDPLIISVNKRLKKQFNVFKANRDQVKQDFVVYEAFKDETKPIDELADNDLKTAWCQNGRTVKLSIKLYKPKNNTLCTFDGLGIVSGNTQSIELLQHNGRIKSATMQLRGIERFSQDKSSISYVLRSIVQDGRDENPYAAVRYFSESNRNENFTENVIQVVGMEGIKTALELNEDINIDFEVLDIYKGKIENICISEIIPLYNCF